MQAHMGQECFGFARRPRSVARCRVRLGSQLRHFALPTIRVRPAIRTTSKLPFFTCTHSVLRATRLIPAALVMGIKVGKRAIDSPRMNQWEPLRKRTFTQTHAWLDENGYVVIPYPCIKQDCASGHTVRLRFIPVPCQGRQRRGDRLVWPIDGLRAPLPPHLQAFEDTDFVELRCTQCSWSATFSASGVRTDTLTAEARAHRCQGEPERVRR